jgi:phage baseplate assembly protein gpV
VEVAVTALPFTCDCPTSIFLGTVKAVDPEKAKVRALIPELKGPGGEAFVTAPLPVVPPWTHGARIFALPRLGQQVYVVFLDRGHVDGIVLGGRYSEKDVVPQNRGAEELYIDLGDKNGTFVSIAPTGDPAHYEIRAETMGGIWIHGGKRLEIAGNDTCSFYGREVTSTAWMKHKLIARELAVKVEKKAAMGCGSIAVNAENGVQIQSDGSIKIKAAKKGIEIQAEGPITIKAPEVSVEADAVTVKAKTIAVDATASLTVTSPAVTINGALTVTGALAAASVAAGGASMSDSGAVSAASVTSSGSVSAASVTASGAVEAKTAVIGGKPYAAHVHTSAAPGSPTSIPV